MNSNFNHDFTNNCIRLEVLANLICEDLQQKRVPSETHLDDFETFTKLQLEYIEELKKKFKN